MEQEFIPLTEDQLIAAEKGEIKLKCRDGKKVLQIMWARPPFAQTNGSVLVSINAIGARITHYKDGRYCEEIGSCYDLFVDEEETSKLQQTQRKHKCSYHGDLEGVPDKVVHLMLKRQVEQGNKEDVSVFERLKCQRKECGGIDWKETPEKEEYWGNVLYKENYDLVPDEPEQPIYQVGEIIEVKLHDTWVDAEFRDTKNGTVCVWANEDYHIIYSNVYHRKKQPQKTVMIDGNEMTVEEAKEYLETI